MRPVGQLEAAQDGLGHIGRALLVAVESRLPARLLDLDRGLAHVVEEGREPQSYLGRGEVHARVKMVEDVEAVRAFLFDAAAGGELGQDDAEHARHFHEPEAPRGRGREQHLEELVADALHRDHREAVEGGGHGGQGRLLDVEPELGREAQRAEGPEPVLAEALHGVAHRAHEAAAEISFAALGVEELSFEEVVGHGVHGEVAAPEVLLDGRGVLDVVGMAAIGVIGLGAEGRHLDLELLPKNRDGAVLDPRRHDAAVELDHLFGPGIRGNVEVAHGPSEEIIAHRPPDEVGFLPGGSERGREFVYFPGRMYARHDMPPYTGRRRRDKP